MRARSGVCIYDWLPQPATDDKGFRATCLCARTMEPALGHVHQLARLLHTVLRALGVRQRREELRDVVLYTHTI
jgi:hypothetical protein